MEYIEIGKIINTHGVKGDLKIYPYTDNIKRFSKLNSIYMGEEKQKLYIENVKYHKNFVLLKLKNLDDINQVIALKEKLIYIKESQKDVLPEGKYFIDDLIACRVFDREGNKLGIIKDVLENNSNDVYIVDYNNNEYMIPAVKEFIKEIDTVKKTVIVELIDGMIE